MEYLKHLAFLIMFTTLPLYAAETISPPVNPAPAPKVIDCESHFSPQIKHIETTILTSWAEQAAVKSFEFDHALLNAQLAKLKACYTVQGWQSFETALQKSGNLQAIQSQHLVVSSQIDGKSILKQLQENQWKVTLPLRVVYQNQQQRLTQKLNIDLMIGRKTNGDLGIMQLVAMPRVSPE